MSAFFLTFVAVAAAMMAGRDAIRVARLRASLGWVAPLLFTVLLAALAGAGLAAWIAQELSPLIRPRVKPLVVGLALALAAGEVLLRSASKSPREPTRSMGAITLVLLLGMVTDASGFIILSLAIATGEPLLAASGGALGAILVLGSAVAAGDDWQALPLGQIRITVGVALLVAAMAIVVSGR